MKHDDSKSLKKDFMKAAKKFTLVMLLALGASMPTVNVSAATGAVPDSAQIVAEAPSYIEQASFSSAKMTGDINPDSTLKFVEVQSRKELLKKYPFMQSIIQDVNETDAAQKSPTSISLSTIKDAETNTQVLLVHLESMGYCGSSGCALKVFVKDSSGYHLAADNLVVHNPIKITHRDGKLSFMFPVTDGEAVWQLDNHKLEMLGVQKKPHSFKANNLR